MHPRRVLARSPARLVSAPASRALASAATRPIPLIDLRAPPEQAAAQIHRACCEIGFFQIVGHGVDEALRSRMISEASAFFQLPRAAKDAISIRQSADRCRGYQRLHENVTQGAADWHEGLDLYSESPRARGSAHGGANLWPAERPSLRAAVEQYVGAMQRVGGLVTSLMARSLGLPPAHFAPFYDDGFWCLRAIRYPPREPAAAAASPSSVAEDAGDAAVPLGVGEHTDYGCLTLLHADETRGALQAQARDGTWLAVEPVAGGFTCNVGDAAC